MRWGLGKGGAGQGGSRSRSPTEEVTMKVADLDKGADSPRRGVARSNWGSFKCPPRERRQPGPVIRQLEYQFVQAV